MKKASCVRSSLDAYSKKRSWERGKEPSLLVIHEKEGKSPLLKKKKKPGNCERRVGGAQFKRRRGKASLDEVIS